MESEGILAGSLDIIVTAGGAKTQFETGAATVGVADIDAHTFTVSIDGQVVRQMPASMGKPSTRRRSDHSPHCRNRPA